MLATLRLYPYVADILDDCGMSGGKFGQEGRVRVDAAKSIGKIDGIFVSVHHGRA